MYKQKAIEVLKKQQHITRANEVTYVGVCEGYAVFYRMADDTSFSVSMANGAVIQGKAPNVAYSIAS